MYEANFELQQSTIEADLILNVTPDKLSQLINDTGFITSAELVPIENDIIDLQNNKVDKIAGKGLSTNDFTDADKSKLEGIEAGAQVNTVNSVNGQTGDVVIEAGSAKWGDITGDLSDQTDLQNALSAKQGTLTATYGLTLTGDVISGKEITDVVDGISAVIPAQATEQNQLADKNFVNSSIATNTANFIGTFNSVAELEAYSGTLTNNDYAFVIGTDADGNTVYNRYKYNADEQEWLFEYALNNSSFTAQQWASINSGITSGDVALIQTALQPSDITNMVTTDTAQDVTNTKTFKAQQKIQSGSADGCLIIGADVSDTTLTNNTRKLGRVTLPPKVLANPNVAIISADTQATNVFSVLPAGYTRSDTNTISFGSAPGDITSTAPDLLGFTIAKTHNATATADKTLALEISKEQAKFNVPPNYNGDNLLTANDIPVNDVTVNGSTVVDNGVAAIPNASGSVTGVVKLSANLTSISDTIAATASMGNNLAKNIITGVNTYSSSSTYDVGDKVRYGQYYYECNTAITTAHAWDANEWTQITIQEQIDEKLDDVTVGGTSIVTNNVAAIPIAQQNGDYGLIKLRTSAYGLGVDSSGYTIVNRATTTDIDDKTAYYKPITPINLDYAVKVGVTTNANTLTDAEKASACSWVGALPNNIYGESTTAASTVQKEVSIPSITSLNAGQLIIVKPTVTSTVADSTLKLNDFDAYPMLYAGNAITTSTDSYVWYANAPVWWLFDGSSWLFAGHGYDYNTTYSAMTQANIIAGTETSARLMRSDYLKNGLFGVFTSYNSGASITLSDKYLYNNTSNITTLTLVAPSSPDVRFLAQVNFSSGSTATTFSYPTTFKVIDGCDDTQYILGVRTFVPVANKRYQVFIESDGVNLTLMAKGV